MTPATHHTHSLYKSTRDLTPPLTHSLLLFVSLCVCVCSLEEARGHDANFRHQSKRMFLVMFGGWVCLASILSPKGVEVAWALI